MTSIDRTSEPRRPLAANTTSSSGPERKLSLAVESLKRTLAPRGMGPQGPRRQPPTQAGTHAARRGANAPALFADLGLPTELSPRQTKELAQSIRAETRNSGEASKREPSLLDPSSLTPLQRLLAQVVNGLPPGALARHPELLEAVRDGFATEGGQQLTWSLNMVDEDIVGQLGSRSRAALLDWSVIARPSTLAKVGFSIDERLPAGFSDAVTAWIGDMQGPLGAGRLADLMKDYPVRIVLDPEQKAVALSSAEGRTVTVNPKAKPADLRAHLDEMSTVAAQRARAAEAGNEGIGLIEQALKFEKSVPAETRQILRAAADNSPTLRNVLLRSIEQHGRIDVVIDNGSSSKARIEFEGQPVTIRLRGAAPDVLAGHLVFELGNAAQSQLLLKALTNPPTRGMSPAQVDTQSAAIQRGRWTKHPVERGQFLSWAWPKHPGRSAASLVQDDAVVNAYLHSNFGGADKVRETTRKVLSLETEELNTVLLAEKVGSELDAMAAAGKLAGPHSAALTAPAIARVRRLRKTIDRWAATGNLRQAHLEAQITMGHTGTYLHRFLDTGDVSAVESARKQIELSEAEVGLTELGADAGSAARASIEEAADTHGAADPEAAHAAAKAGTLEHSNALAQQIVENPQVIDTLRGAGRVVTVAAVASMAVELGQAIHTDALSGDKTAPATRKALAELLGGVLGAEAGAIAGAAAGGLLGGAVGSLVPIVGNVVGAFVGGIAGGLAGGISGWIGGSRQGKSLEHLVDELISAKGKDDTPWVKAGSPEAAQLPPHDGAAIVRASGSEDDHVNADELRQGWKALNLEVDIGERQLAMLINAYGNRGAGALSPRDIDRAFADGALFINGEGQLAAEPLEFSLNLDTAEQRGRAVQLARRLVALGASGEGDDLLLNTEELMGALKDAGCDCSDDAGRFARLVAACDRSGEGALDEAEISLAIQDGALEFDTQGSAFVNDQAITGQAGDSAANIALRIVKAGPGDDLLATADDLKEGMKEAGFDPTLNDEEWQRLIATHGNGRTGLISPEGLGRAIADGALVIDADGDVSANRSVLWPHPADPASPNG